MSPTKTEEPQVSGLDIAIRTADVAEVWSREQINLLLKEYAAKGTTIDEFSAFLLIAKRYELDPFTHEIWLPDFDGTGQHRAPFVGRDGLLSIAERSGQFDGLVSGVVRVGDSFEQGIQEPTHHLGAERGDIMYAYAYVYRKDRRYPFRVIAEWSEFGRPKTRDDAGKLRTGPVTKTPWFKFSSLMIKKVAEANALRLAFKVSGVVATADAVTPIGDDDSSLGEIVDAEIVEDPRPAEAPEAGTPAAGSSRIPDGSAEPDGDNLFNPAEAEAAAAPEPEWKDPA